MALGGPGSEGGEELESVGGIFADINITPLTDIFLVLLIIFMVTTTAIAEAGNEDGGFEVNLPRGGKADEAGVVRDEDAALKDAFAAAHARSAQTVVLFQADEGVPHGRVVQVMEMARQVGLSRLAIATRAEPAPGP
jgi:biopolymer transport protein ExbD